MTEPRARYDSVSQAILRRRSVRAFLDRPVEREVLEAVLKLAARAPSGGNMQPWKITVLAGDELQAFRLKVAETLASAPLGGHTEYDVYPKVLPDHYRHRTKQIGEAMYALIGIERSDREGRRRWFARNFDFFGAPVGIFCHISRDMGPPQWADLGMYLQTLMLALQEQGIDSCAQEAWAALYETVDAFLTMFKRSSFQDVDFTTETFKPGTSGEAKLRNDLREQILG